MTRGERPPAARQLPLDLPHHAAMSRADFLVGSGNEKAVALIDRWPLWPERGVLLAGPVGSGKSHLVEIWHTVSGGAVVRARDLDSAGADRLAAHLDQGGGTPNHGFAGAVAVEDLHAGPIDEAALFHLLNLAGERRAAVLMTSRLWPAALPIRLADLASRLRLAQPVELQEPDDDLLRRVLAKLFADRQLLVDPAVIDFIVVRMERSLEAANGLVDRLDREALAQGRAVSRRLAALAVAELFDHQPDFWPEGGH